MPKIIIDHHGKSPQIKESNFIAPNATIIGEVEIGENTNIWFNTVIRGDVHWIKIGENSNVQDLSMLHVSNGKAPLSIGNEVTVGHRCTLHGCTIKDRVLVGMDSTIMDLAVIGEDVIIGAGSLVTEKTNIPSGSLALGRPAKVVRPLSKEEIAYIKKSAKHYVRLAESYG